MLFSGKYVTAKVIKNLKNSKFGSQATPARIEPTFLRRIFANRLRLFKFSERDYKFGYDFIVPSRRSNGSFVVEEFFIIKLDFAFQRFLYI